MKLYDSPLNVIHREEYPRRILWLGALSFESRCNGSIVSLLDEDIDIFKAYAFDYPTSLSSKSHGEENRSLNKKDFFRLLGDRAELLPIHPYRYAEFIGQLEKLAAEATTQEFPCQIIVDITCLTKIHTLAVAYWLLTRDEQTPVSLAYSRPELYGNPSRNIWGKGKWITTLQVRLDLNSTELFSSTWAIAILGHEGDRLRLALSDAEPNEGLLIKVLPLEPIPSKLATVSDIQNAWLYNELQKGMRPGFKRETLQLSNLSGLYDLVSSYCSDAKKKGARIVLCPFGPKPFVFCSGYAVLSICPETSWLYYPIPVSYDPEYSTGYKNTVWFDPEEPRDSAKEGLGQNDLFKPQRLTRD